MDIDFYYVDSHYIEFLKKYERIHRGFTCVPNTQYSLHQKFVFGAVLQMNRMNYFVPVSSQIKMSVNNIVIRIPKKKKLVSVASLRFAYMIPVPNQCLVKINVNNDIDDYSRKQLMRGELAFCRRNIHKITQQAEKTYNALTNSSEQKILKNACDFKLLEKAYNEYSALLPYYLKTSAEGVELLRQNKIDFEVHPSTKNSEMFVVKLKTSDAPQAQAILSTIKPLIK